jgi:cell division protein FtsW (lipid II flippase)
MSRVWRQLAIATNWPILVAVVVLSAAGLLSIWQAVPGDGIKQLVWIVFGFGLMLAMQSFHYLSIGRYSWLFYIASLLLIIYTVLGAVTGSMPGVSRINGAYAWITLAGGRGQALFSMEPSELMKLSFVLVLARYLRFRSNYRTLPGLLPPFALALVPMFLILKQPDLGVAALFVPGLLAMLFVAGAKVRHMLAIIGIGAALVPLVWFSGTDRPVFRHMPTLLRDYQRNRVDAMFSHDPRTNQGSGMQQHRALVALGSGGWIGKGIGTIPIGHTIPEAQTDMVFALIGEQFGFVGSAVVLIAYLVLFVAGIEIAAATREPFGRLVALGIVSFLASQTLINLLVVVRLFPVTGVTLPFASYGGSSLLASALSVGLLLNIGQNRPLMIARDSFEFD